MTRRIGCLGTALQGRAREVAVWTEQKRREVSGVKGRIAVDEDRDRVEGCLFLSELLLFEDSAVLCCVVLCCAVLGACWCWKKVGGRKVFGRERLAVMRKKGREGKGRTGRFGV